MTLLVQVSSSIHCTVFRGEECLVFLLLLLFFFFSLTLSIWRFPGQGLNLSHSCSNVGSLTHCTGPGIEPAPLERQAGSLTHCATGGTPRMSHFRCLFFFFFFFLLFRATPTAYGVSRARGPVGAVATGLCHSHARSLTH